MINIDMNPVIYIASRNSSSEMIDVDRVSHPFK